ncbi:hypothetical protein BDF20DRAFT_871861 [Mycotypha africana]|uniref:uncharacterized protein n=1 Tax=Mycotypha africana TaxID=64632 RepID=UPI002301F5EF|nr:uncharacterized protein BDF20DRAFT_871861 [Mycotypha africana]KAI8979815.1 hypothetical protein BDF20DRAFT_871861 [Mycotypha africana]
MGHFNKSYPKCKYHKAVSADDVESRNKKRKQSASVEVEKKAVKKKKLKLQAVECPSCGNDNHAFSRSPPVLTKYSQRTRPFHLSLGIILLFL